MPISTLFGLLDAPKDKTPAKSRGLPVRKTSQVYVGLQDAGVLVQLLAGPEPAKCPHCGKTVPPPKLKTRRRQLYALVSSAGALMHLEIDP